MFIILGNSAVTAETETELLTNMAKSNEAKQGFTFHVGSGLCIVIWENQPQPEDIECLCMFKSMFSDKGAGMIPFNHSIPLDDFLTQHKV